MTEEDKINQTIEEMTAQLATLQKRQQYLATKKKEAEALKASENRIGYYAAKSCREHLTVIRMVAAQLDIDKQSDSDILNAFSLINSNSWQAIKALERDAAERGEE